MAVIMQYRILAGEKVSILGFGAMRLPSDGNTVKEKESVELMRAGVDMGINYIDTAYIYHGGASEMIVGKALKDGYRDKVMVATKLPLWTCNEPADLEKRLTEQLVKLGTDRIDFYLVHALGHEMWDKAKKLGVTKFLEKAKKDGKIRHFGFSFHDRYDAFEKIINEYNWEFCQIQHNIMDEEFQAGTKGLKLAASKGVGVIVMEPLRGGNLANGLPDAALKIYNGYKIKRTPAEWALRWVWNHPETAVALSGMNTFEQLAENARIAAGAEADSFSDEEFDIIEKIKHEFTSRIKVNCTNCGYCLPCRIGVDIPHNFSLYNSLFMYDNPASAKMGYNMFMAPSKKAGACVECGICESKCPQKINIIDELKNANAALVN